MKVRDQPAVYGHTIFCDDIRLEVGEKLSFIGVYDGTIVLHNPYPFVFPKFCFFITLIQRREILDPNIEVRIFMPGDAEDTPAFIAVSSETSEGAVAEYT